MNTAMKLMAAAAAIAIAGAASAQSHSVTNMANPPQTQSDTKAGTEATPGRTATAEKNTSKQKDKNGGKGHATSAKSGSNKAGKADSKAASQDAASDGGKVETSGSSVTGERVDAGSSATAISGMGAGNGDGGAEGAMEIKPSDAYVNPVERRALDVAPKSGKMPGKD